MSFISSPGTSRIPTADGSTGLPGPLAARLARAGFALVPEDAVLAAWRAAVTGEGGIFDRRTGRPDSLRTRSALARTARTLRDSLGADLWLQYGLVDAMAEYDAGTAQWDGQKCDIGDQGLILTLLTGVEEGQVPAVSLQLEVRDPDDRLLYVRRAGLVSRRHMVRGRWIPLPADTLLSPSLCTKALDRALGPWIARVRPDTTAE